MRRALLPAVPPLALGAAPSPFRIRRFFSPSLGARRRVVSPASPLRVRPASRRRAYWWLVAARV